VIAPQRDDVVAERLDRLPGRTTVEVEVVVDLDPLRPNATQPPREDDQKDEDEFDHLIVTQLWFATQSTTLNCINMTCSSLALLAPFVALM
jgi:hypothetical protein